MSGWVILNQKNDRIGDNSKGSLPLKKIRYYILYIVCRFFKKKRFMEACIRSINRDHLVIFISYYIFKS